MNTNQTCALLNIYSLLACNTLCFVGRYLQFRGTCCLPIQGTGVNSVLSWKWRLCVHLKCQYPCTEVHVVTYQEIVIPCLLPWEPQISNITILCIVSCAAYFTDPLHRLHHSTRQFRALLAHVQLWVFFFLCQMQCILCFLRHQLHLL